MEDFSYRLSPKVRDFASTQTTDLTSSRFSSGCKMCPRTPVPCPKEDLTVTDLKREYSKAMNCIEILKLEKKNLQDALSFTKDLKKDKTEKYFMSSTKSTAVPSPKSDFRPMRSVDGDRRVADLELELMEQRKLYDRISAQNEDLREENYNYRERLEQIDDLQLQNHQLKKDIKEMTEELRRESRRVYELQEENDQLLDRRSQVANSARKLPPKELYKYLDHVYELIGSLNKNHYAPYHFRECFIDEDNIETLIEEKETNQLLVQSFRYITNLLVNINSSVAGGSSIDQRRASQTVLTDSGSMNYARIERRDQATSYNNLGNASNMQQSVHEDQDQEEIDVAAEYPPYLTPTLNTPKNLNLAAVNREIDAVQPHSFGDVAPIPLSQQDLSPNNRNQSKAYSPSNSRHVTSNPYSNKPNTDINTTRRDLVLSRNASAKSGVSISPNNRRDKSPTNALNVSKQSLNRSHISQRTAQNQAEANLNASRVSRQSQGKSFVSQKTKQNGPVSVAELNASKVSQAKSKVLSRQGTRQTIINNEEEQQPYYGPASVNALNASRVSQAKSKVLTRQGTRQTIINNEEEQQQYYAPVSVAELNASKVSQAKSKVLSRQGTRQTIINNEEEQQYYAPAAEVNALNASRVSQAKSKVSHHTTRQNIGNYDEEPQQQQFYTERAGMPRSTHDLEDREQRLRDLDRELQEKDRLLQMKEKELKDRSVMEKSMTRYRAQQEEAEINRSTISQARKLASQKSLPKEKSFLQSKQRLDESRDHTRVAQNQSQLKGGQSHVIYPQSNANLNKSSNSVVQSRIIPSMSSLNDVDASPKAFGATPRNAATQPAIKSLTRIGNSIQSLDPYNEYQRSPKNFSAVPSQKTFIPASTYDVDGNSVARTGQRTPFHEAYLSAQSFDNSPKSKVSPKPQTLERLENSGIKLIDQRGGEYYDEDGQIYDNNQIYEPTPIHMASPHSDHTKRRITFDTRNLEEIEECETSPQSKSLSRKMSIGERSGQKQGTEYASFRVSFGRTQSKYPRSTSPDLDQKDSCYIVDVARRKRVTHHEQTYDVVQGNEVRYDLNSQGPDYSVTKKKPRSKYERREPREHSQSENNLERSQTPPCTNRADNVSQ